MLQLLLTFILGIAAIQARVFNNPVLNSGDYREPAAIKANGTYYIATNPIDSNQPEKFEIQESTDLINWKQAGHIFDDTNYPTWADKFKVFEGAKIHKIRGNFHVYFNAYHNVTGLYSIGVAVAPHPLGPYSAIDRPLLSNDSSMYSTIAKENGNLYLIWDYRGDFIYARQLSSDGLSFASNQTFQLFGYNLAWEYNNVKAPWYIRRGNYHYIMYTGHTGCGKTAIGVARSRTVLGPYEKLASPILVANSILEDPGFHSIIPDLDDKSDIIVFQTHRSTVDCYIEYVISMASLGWGPDNWPFVNDF